MIRTVLRSVGAVVAGFVVNALVEGLLTTMLHSIGFEMPAPLPGAPPVPMLTSVFAAMVIRDLFSGLAGGVVLSFIAPFAPVRHALVLVLILIVMGPVMLLVQNALPPAVLAQDVWLPTSSAIGVFIGTVLLARRRRRASAAKMG